jgi:cytochrome c-type biogenesis protein CcmH/NrfG
VKEPKRGLPLRIALPLVAAFAAVFLGLMGYLVFVGYGSGGSVFGAGGTGAPQTAQQRVEGGPPAAVMLQYETLRRRVAEHPDDDVALTQLGDMELAANRFSDAIPYYRRALAANPRNVAAQTGLAEAREALREAAQ